LIVGFSFLFIVVAGIFTIFFIRDYEFKDKEYREHLKYKLIYYTQKKLSKGSGGARLDQYKVALHAFIKNPIFGIGTLGFMNSENYQKYSEGISLRNRKVKGRIIHSNIFAILGENGLFGFIPYILIIGLGIMYSWKLYRQSERYIFILGIQLMSFFISNTINTLYFNFYWLVQFLPFLYYSKINTDRYMT